MSLRLLLLSTPVGPLGSGLGGGVEFTVVHLAKVLADRDHSVTIAAPAGSELPFVHPRVTLVQVSGELQTTAQSQHPSAPVVTSEVLAKLWDYGRRAQANHDLLVNFAYDWLPFYLTPFLTTPVIHFVSMGSLSEAMDSVIAAQPVGTLGAYTQTQVSTFAGTRSQDWTILGCGLELSLYPYSNDANTYLAWAGRIAPEKGLEDAIAATARTCQPLKIFGQIEDHTYWQAIQKQIARAAADIEYCGFLSGEALRQHLRKARALVMTPKWIEAFGIVAIEALACGVPLIAYARGGPTEIVRNGKTGWLVEPDSVDGLCAAIARIPEIDRQRCRDQAVSEYSLVAWGDRFEQWFYQILSGNISS